MKTVVIPFTQRLKHYLKEPRMGDVTMKFSEDIKYLGITLDSKLYSLQSRDPENRDPGIPANFLVQ
jgi:hypothetical protein